MLCTASSKNPPIAFALTTSSAGKDGANDRYTMCASTPTSPAMFPREVDAPMNAFRTMPNLDIPFRKNCVVSGRSSAISAKVFSPVARHRKQNNAITYKKNLDWIKKYRSIIVRKVMDVWKSRSTWPDVSSEFKTGWTYNIRKPAQHQQNYRHPVRRDMSISLTNMDY